MTTMTLQMRDDFSQKLFRVMKETEPAVQGMELYEFEYGLNNLVPEAGWPSVICEPKEQIEQRVSGRSFYDAIEIKPRVGDRIILDKEIVRLTNMLFAGLVRGEYEPAWVQAHFYFDVRSFFFLHRTSYFTNEVLEHLGGNPLCQFEKNQRLFDHFQDIGYKAFREANAGLDACFIDAVHQLVGIRRVPVVLAIAGPTAAGKTEITARLHASFQERGQQTASIEMDNFLTDRDYREKMGIFTQGTQALHLALFKQCLLDITNGKKIFTPRYDFVYATSSHDLDGKLKPDGAPIEIEAADIVFLEGNFPFLIPEVADLIGIKVVYLTDDPIRLKRKWKRDIDYRKKYEPSYFRNRFFKDQFIMAEIAYRPQMEMCDLVVDTTGGALWASRETASLLSHSANG